MNAPLSHANSGRAPLFGHNLVRLLYLDEAGIDHKAPVLCVAGVLVHGDQDYPEVDRRILALIDKYIPEEDRRGFVFHAADIFHGARYFDRRKDRWNSSEKRVPILNDLAQIIADLHLPVVSGNYQKDKAAIATILPNITAGDKGTQLHNAAAMDCLIAAERWLGQFAPTELATVIHEDGDGTRAKRLIKRTLQLLRDTETMDAEGISQESRQKLGLPLKRIIDTVHFAEKADARPLQLADLCAFIMGRGLKELDVPTVALEIIWRHMRWAFKDAPAQASLRPSPRQPA